MAHAQLQLITPTSGHQPHADWAREDHEELWKLDARTIQVGRQGLAQARAALTRSRRTVEGRCPASGQTVTEQDQATAA